MGARPEGLRPRHLRPRRTGLHRNAAVHRRHQGPDPGRLSPENAGRQRRLQPRFHPSRGRAGSGARSPGCRSGADPRRPLRPRALRSRHRKSLSAPKRGNGRRDCCLTASGSQSASARRSRTRIWPPQLFARMVAGFSDRGWGAVLLGSPKERPLSDRFLAVHSRSVVNLVGDTSIEELAAALDRCAVYVGNNSGPSASLPRLENPLSRFPGSIATTRYCVLTATLRRSGHGT